MYTELNSFNKDVRISLRSEGFIDDVDLAEVIAAAVQQYFDDRRGVFAFIDEVEVDGETWCRHGN